jgi:predicted DCC family thiol-disulfide oxidoreductase YuxK
VRRIVTEPASYLAELARAVVRGWDALFFSAADPTSLGLIRVAIGLLACWSLLVLGLDLSDYFGSAGWAEPDAIRALARPLSWSFWFLVPDGWLLPVWLVCLVVLALFAAGLFSRVTAVLSWVIVVSTVRRVPVALYGFDQILSALTFYLAVSGASGQAVSLDRFWRRWREARAQATRVNKHPGGSGRGAMPDEPVAPEVEAWPDGYFHSGRRVMPDEPGAPQPTVSANLGLRLIQLHLVVIYGMAGLSKLQGPSWWTGLAIWKTMTTGEFVTLDFTALAAWPVLINALTHLSLALELMYPVLIWVRIVRPLVLGGVVALHVGIAVVSPGLSEFALAMVAGNLAFVSGSWLRGLVTGRERPALRVLYDGACPRCRASMALIRAADPDCVIEPVDLTAVAVASVHPSLTREACLRSMHAVSRAGKVSVGFDAVRSAAGCLPLFWPLAWVSYLPGVAWAGRVVYNRAAATRPRDVPCTDDVCGLHSRTPRTMPRDRGIAQNHHSTIATLADTEEGPHP